MSVQIRFAVKKDYNQLLELLRQLNPDDPEFSEIEELVFEEILKSKYLFLMVAEKDNKLLGSCYLNIIPNLSRGGKPYSIIENVITDIHCRNQGIGKALINRTVEIAYEKGCYKVMLMSGRTEESVHSFYRSCGFDGGQKQAYIKRHTNKIKNESATSGTDAQKAARPF